MNDSYDSSDSDLEIVGVVPPPPVNPTSATEPIELLDDSSYDDKDEAVPAVAASSSQGGRLSNATAPAATAASVAARHPHGRTFPQSRSVGPIEQRFPTHHHQQQQRRLQHDGSRQHSRRDHEPHPNRRLQSSHLHRAKNHATGVPSAGATMPSRPPQPPIRHALHQNQRNSNTSNAQRRNLHHQQHHPQQRRSAPFVPQVRFSPLVNRGPTSASTCRLPSFPSLQAAKSHLNRSSAGTKRPSTNETIDLCSSNDSDDDNDDNDNRNNDKPKKKDVIYLSSSSDTDDSDTDWNKKPAVRPDFTSSNNSPSDNDGSSDDGDDEAAKRRSYSSPARKSASLPSYFASPFKRNTASSPPQVAARTGSMLRAVPRGGRSARALLVEPQQPQQQQQQKNKSRPARSINPMKLCGPQPVRAGATTTSARDLEEETIRKELAATLKYKKGDIHPTHLSPNRSPNLDLARQSLRTKEEKSNAAASSSQNSAANPSSEKEASKDDASQDTVDTTKTQTTGERSAESDKAAVGTTTTTTNTTQQVRLENNDVHKTEAASTSNDASIFSETAEENVSEWCVASDGAGTVCLEDYEAETFQENESLQDVDMTQALGESEQDADMLQKGLGQDAPCELAAQRKPSSLQFEYDLLLPVQRPRREVARRSQQQSTTTAESRPPRVSASPPSLPGDDSFSLYEAPEDSDVEYETDEEDEGEDHLEIPLSMSFLDQLCSLTADSVTGLPVWKFTVVSGSHDILFDFVVNIRPSSVCAGAGLGAFLTFKGAQKLKDGLLAKTDAEPEETEEGEPVNTDELQARLPTGYGVTVCLEGKASSSICHHNSKVGPPMDVFSVASPGMPINRTMDGGFQCRTTKEFKVSDLARNIGQLNFQESEYQPEPNLKVSTELNSICLGRYGPFRRSDRKTDETYTIKNFIFDSKPAEYAFAVQERIHGRVQVIDITDDRSGSPHELARKHMCMYVNEVGHNNKHMQNVFIREVDERTVLYYLCLPEPMEKGETVELLTNYYYQYEDVRERNGYGLRNLRNKVESDDVRAAKLSRGFSDRKHAEDTILSEDAVSVSELVDLLEFILSEIWQPLFEEACRWEQSSNHDVSPLTSKQWVAMRRIQWLRHVFLRRIELAHNELDAFEAVCGRHAYPFRQSLKYCEEELLKGMQRDLYRPVLQLVENAVDSYGNGIAQAIREDALEEVCYCLKEMLPMPFDGSMWCPASQELVERLCDLSAPFHLCPAETPTEQARLLDEILGVAVVARDTILKVPDTPSTSDKWDSVAFDSGLQSYIGNAKKFLIGTLEQTLCATKSSSSFFLDNSTTPKGFRSAIIEKLAYMDALVVGGIDPQVERLCVPLEVDNKFFMVGYSQFSDNESLQPLGSVPRSFSSAVRTSSKLNKTWYIVWEIAYPVHVFASQFLEDSGYSLKKLCEKLEIDEDLMEFAVSRGIQQDPDTQWKRLISANIPTPMRRRNKKPNKKKKLYTGEAKQKKVKNGSARGKKPVRIPAQLQSEGPPDLVVPEHKWWPEGWVQRTYVRMSGATAGDTDRYWFTPQNRYKLRSGNEIKKFLAWQEECNGDEEQAWRHFKKGTR